MSGFALAAFLKAALFQNLLCFGQHFRAAAEHHTVVVVVKLWQTDIGKELPRTNKVGQTTAIL